MKAALNLTNNKFLSVSKNVLYALQVLIIACTIPVLSYVELSHKEDTTQQPTQKNTGEVVILKTGEVAYTQIIK